MFKSCDTCGTPFKVKPSHYHAEHSCSKECSKARRSQKMKGERNHQFGLRGSKNASWKGGRRLSNYGYWLVTNPDQTPGSPTYRFEHRLIMETHLGRRLRPDEHVHHINEIRTDNRIENLQVLTRGEHVSLHQQDWTIVRNPTTGRIITLKKNSASERNEGGFGSSGRA